jgi:hypothetical protein
MASLNNLDFYIWNSRKLDSGYARQAKVDEWSTPGTDEFFCLCTSLHVILIGTLDYHRSFQNTYWRGVLLRALICADANAAQPKH